jgi:hypothetical protein
VPTCLHCGTALDDDAIVCPSCGTPVPRQSPHKRLSTGSSGGDRALGTGVGCVAALAFFFVDAFLGAAMVNQTGYVFAYIAVQVALLIGLIVYYRKLINRDLTEAMRTGLIVFTIFTCVTLGLLAACDSLFMNFRMD